MYRRNIIQDLGAGGAIAISPSIAGWFGQGTSGATSADVDGKLVEMTDDNRFDPTPVTIPIGETVVWRTVGDAPHTVTAYEEELPTEAEVFASGGFMNEAAARKGASGGAGVLSQGEEYAPTFDVPGEYNHFFLPHEQDEMTGTINVARMAESGDGGA